MENVVIQKSSKYSYLNCLKKIVEIFSFKKNKFQTLFQIPDYKNKKKYITENNIKNIVNKNIVFNLNHIELIINTICQDIDMSIKHNFKLINLLKPSKLLAHHARWSENLITINNSKKLKIPVYLISHGSHCINDDPFINKEIFIHLNDMLISPLADKLIIQSAIAYKTVNFFNKSDNIIKSKPIMWGYKKFINKKLNPNIFTILHASTTKNLLSRPFMYETSFEYLKGLKQLSDVVKKINNCKLIIKFRSTNEINGSTIHKWIGSNKNIVVKEGGDFIEDLNNSDLLVSYSSTTIEEALNLRKPVLLYGGNDYYSHLSKKIIDFKNNSNLREAIYFSPKNLNNTIMDLMNKFYNKPLIDDEVNQYIYNLKNTNNYSFIDNFVLTNE